MTERINGITGIVVDKTERVHMLESAKQLGLVIEDESTIDNIATQLWSHFQQTVQTADRVTCWNCKAVSNVNLDVCPFCKAGDPPEEEEKKNGGVEKPASPPKEATMTASAATETKSAKKKKTNGAAASKALAVVAKSATAIRGEKDLDSAVSEIQRLKGEGAVAMWRLGAKIREIYEAQLWKMRVGEDGKSRYKSVEAFCAHELGMTPKNAYKLIDISRYFSEDQVRAFGTSKLGLLLEAPPEDQKKLVDKLEKGKREGKIPTFREVERDVREVNRGKKDAKPARDGTKRNAGAQAKPKKKKTQITVASILGSQTVKLYSKAPRNTDVAELKRAKRIGDLPWGRMELMNDVVMYFGVQEAPSGEWVIRVETKREE